MSCGNKNGGPRLSAPVGNRGDEVGPLCRGRPSRRVGVAVSYRPRTSEEEKHFNDAVRMLIVSMVRERMATIKEVET